MNKLITENTGGFPLMLDDFRFLDGIYRQGIESILKTIVLNTNCILWGCEISTNNITEGVVWINNELFSFPGGIIDDANRYFSIYEELSSYRLFGDGTTSKAVHLLRSVVLDDSGTTIYLPKIKDIIANFSNKMDIWNIVANEGPDRYIKYRKINNGTFLQIKLRNSTQGEDFLQLPTDFRPSEDFYFSAFEENSFVNCIVEANGRVKEVVPAGGSFVFDIIVPLK